MTGSGDMPLPIDRVPPSDCLLTQWTIYQHPADYREGYVLRAAYVMKNHDVWMDSCGWYSEDVESLRALVPPGLVRLARLANDDPAILEVWT